MQRRNFLKISGLSAGAVVTGGSLTGILVSCSGCKKDYRLGLMTEPVMVTEGDFSKLLSFPSQAGANHTLSAQSTDVQINKVTEKLFKKYRTVEDYASADLRELENDLYSTGFYKSKAKNIKAAAQIIIEKYNGGVPKTMEELITLPGVGRKTANIVLARGFGIIEGIAGLGLVDMDFGDPRR